MNKQASQIIAFAVIVGFVAGLTGCTTVCHKNKKGGFATIICQPMDVKVKTTNQPVSFNVVATGCALTYRWYRNEQSLTEADEKEGGFIGVFEHKLTIFGTNKYHAASYSCEIGSKDSLGDEKRTTTRNAFLDFLPSFKISALSLNPPTANLPKPGKRQSYSGHQYCSFAKFTGIRPPTNNTAPTYCKIQFNMETPLTPRPIPTLLYFLRMRDGNGVAVQVVDVNATTRKFMLAGGPPYEIYVYYDNCSGSTGGTLSVAFPP